MNLKQKLVNCVVLLLVVIGIPAGVMALLGQFNLANFMLGIGLGFAGCAIVFYYFVFSLLKPTIGPVVDGQGDVVAGLSNLLSESMKALDKLQEGDTHDKKKR